MPAYLDQHRSILERVNTKQVSQLLRVLGQLQLNKQEFVASRYGERASNFLETLTFLVNLRLLTIQDDQILLNNDSKVLVGTTEEALAAELLLAMRSSKVYMIALAKYLSSFKISENQIESRPVPDVRLSESAIRNLLIDLRAVHYDNYEDRFLLTQLGIHHYFWAQNLLGLKSKKSLLRKSDQQEVLGAAAEKIVVNFERERVGEQLAPRVRHVSATSPFACYDIESITACQSMNTFTTRYIEVKAVSFDSYAFFWTPSEVEAARLLGEAYYLYLLPVIEGSFKLDKMLIIEGAYGAVYQAKDSWDIEENVILCRRIDHTHKPANR